MRPPHCREIPFWMITLTMPTESASVPVPRAGRGRGAPWAVGGGSPATLGPPKRRPTTNSRAQRNAGNSNLRRKDQEEVFSPDTKVTSMKITSGLKPGIWGTVIGFSQFGWTLGGHRRADGERASCNRGRCRASTDLRREIPAAGRCTRETGGVRQSAHVPGSGGDHREGRLGDDAGKRYSERSGCQRLCGAARQPVVVVRTRLGELLSAGACFALGAAEIWAMP